MKKKLMKKLLTIMITRNLLDSAYYMKHNLIAIDLNKETKIKD